MQHFYVQNLFRLCANLGLYLDPREPLFFNTTPFFVCLQMETEIKELSQRQKTGALPRSVCKGRDEVAVHKNNKDIYS